jgi:hypothetical protein
MYLLTPKDSPDASPRFRDHHPDASPRFSTLVPRHTISRGTRSFVVSVGLDMVKIFSIKFLKDINFLKKLFLFSKLFLEKRNSKKTFFIFKTFFRKKK